MKKFNVLFLLSIVFPGILLAQPVLNRSEMLPYGSTMKLSYAIDYTLIDTTIRGEGVTWNFTGLVKDIEEDDLTIEIVNPITSPYGSNFPSSNYAYKETYNENGGAAYRYFNLSNTSMQRVGSEIGGYLNIYTNPQTEYVFPLQLNTTNTDTWKSTNSDLGGTYTLKCIGTGTLKLPGGSFNALMVKMLIYDGPFLFEGFFWYSADNGAILLQYLIGDGLFSGTYAAFSSGVTIGFEEPFMLAGLKYNNPVDKELNLTFNNQVSKDYNYQISDINGRVLIQGKPEMDGDNAVIQADLFEFRQGIYFLNIFDQETNAILESIRIAKVSR